MSRSGFPRSVKPDLAGAGSGLGRLKAAKKAKRKKKK